MSLKSIELGCINSCPWLDVDHPPERKCGVYFYQDDPVCRAAMQRVMETIIDQPNILGVEVEQMENSSLGLDVDATIEILPGWDSDYQGPKVTVGRIWDGKFIPTNRLGHH